MPKAMRKSSKPCQRQAFKAKWSKKVVEGNNSVISNYCYQMLLVLVNFTNLLAPVGVPRKTARSTCSPLRDYTIFTDDEDAGGFEPF